MGRPCEEKVALKDGGELAAGTAGDHAGDGGGPGV